MGQKVNPIGLRLGINRTWDSRWFADGEDYGRLLHEDIKIRKELKKRLGQAGVSRIIIERPHKCASLKPTPSWWPRTSPSSSSAGWPSAAP